MKNCSWNIQCSDAFAWLNSLEQESVDLIITDPPYESLEKYRAIGTTTRLKVSKSSSNLWFPIIKNDRFEELLTIFYRILKKNRHFYLFCDPETMFVIKPIAERIGFKFWKPIIWDKMKIGMGYHYRARYENILFFEKGKKKLNDLSIPDILSCERVLRGYPTEKPSLISEILIRQSSSVGDLVLDPFIGSGSVGEAAIKNGRRFLGCDIQEYAVNLSRERIEKVKIEQE